MPDSVHLVCPHCQSINRIGAARLADSPRCGKCHQPLFTGHPVELDSAAFTRQLEHSDVPLLVDFWASWCGPCRAMAPQYAAAAAELEPQVRVAKLDTDAAQDVAGQFGIRSIPTLILFRAGKEIARQSGALGKADILRWVRAHL